MTLPRWPIYIPSKGRAAACLTAECFAAERVPFFLVVETSEQQEYAARFGSERVLTLPFSDAGSVIPARNWIKQHATKTSYDRHWQFDDNIRGFRKWHAGKRFPCSAAVAIRAIEDFTDRYENIAVAGPNYTVFAHQTGRQPHPPFWLNVHVYSACLVLNALPYRWRGRYNEDTDLCLQALAHGWCTVLFNAFMVDKVRTMTMKGGNTQVLYQGDGRLKMARSLERLWPGVVETKRRWQRPQHVVKDSWRKFDTPLRLKPGIDLSQIPPNDYGLKLTAVKEVKSETLKRLLEEEERKREAGNAASR